MRQLILERCCYSETETEGRLYFGKSDEDYVYTLERPWVPGVPGGLPFESCVPDGEYDLIPHTRPKGGGQVLALQNAALHVYYTKQERGDNPGRYLILIHAANYVEEVAGCIAPGLVRTIAGNRRMVRSSRLAVQQIMSATWDSIEIRAALGTDPE